MSDYVTKRIAQPLTVAQVRQRVSAAIRDGMTVSIKVEESGITTIVAGRDKIAVWPCIYDVFPEFGE